MLDARQRPRCTLAGGSAGAALAFAHLAAAGHGDALAPAAERWLDVAVSDAGNARLAPDLYDGFTGVGWTLAHVARLRKRTDGDDLRAVDGALLEWVRNRTSRHDFDLTRGLVGFGVYALERLPDPSGAELLTTVVEGLCELAETAPDGLRWSRHDKPESPAGQYDLGLAHGSAGVVALLAATCEAGIAADRASALLEGAVSWLLAQEGQVGDGSRFPYFVDARGPSGPARLAWCYGDLGIAIALLRAADAAGVPAWRDAALGIARAAAARRGAGTGVVDAGLCHGAAGVAHCFGRLASATGDDDLADAAAHWLDRALALREPGVGVGGYLAAGLDQDGNRTWDPDPGLLTGAAGVALALHAATSDREPSWDRFLLLGSPEPISRSR